ncbi:MAG TPA: tRNA (adenosine(37)-N6)-dimethylallyltransferase MiaA [Holophagaceae bacterium]|nr:tRNA (adenosine(37)-N6)-dimethylallyltransferase MiaA [Holophagaceae bacterium]
MPIAILGPTASGKSALAVAVAARIGGTVVNGDPFQAIQGLGIGTGQPEAAERQGVPHVGYGVLPLSARPNPKDFGDRVRGWLATVERPVLVTGSGLYLRGIWDQLSELPHVPVATVARVRTWGEILGIPVLHRYLAAVDPARAEDLHPNDAARVQRALALHLATGRRPSDLFAGVAQGLPEGWRALVVQPTREAQRARIVRRIRGQVAAGWPDEVAALVAEGHGPDLEALRPLGYREWMTGGDPRRLEAEIVTATQQYAKRQATFFRNQWPEVPTWDPDAEPLDAAFRKLDLP